MQMQDLEASVAKLTQKAQLLGPRDVDMGYSTFWSAPTALASHLKKQSFKPLQSSCIVLQPVTETGKSS